MPNSSKALDGMRILVVGLGLSGRSAAGFLLSRGADVIGVDRNAGLLEGSLEIAGLRSKGLRTFPEDHPIDFGNVGMVVVSPGIPKNHPIYRKALEHRLDVLGEIELACRYIENKTLGITGTNGKTTVTLMTAHILNCSGRPAKALGNAGIPLTSALISSEPSVDNSIYVVELSSYQLETLQVKILDAAAVLNITPDHLDRYRSMEEYAMAKMSIKDCLKPGAPLYVEEKCFKEFRYLLKDFPARTYGYVPGCFVRADQTSLVYKENIESILPPEYRGNFSHDVENLLAAYALCREMGVSSDEFFGGLATFRKPPHRIEFVRSKGGVVYIDDSKGTNIDAVVRAVGSLKGGIILIAGGVDKGAAYTPWIEAFAGRVRCICAIGEAAEKIKGDLSRKVQVELFHSLEEAVKHASKIARDGESVLLSPGCSSFDMFRDYAHRGEEFKRIVHAL